MLQNAVERALQAAIEAMIDVAERILALNKIPPRNSAAKSMLKLQELNIPENASKYKEIVRFRNYIVHRYENIDLKIIYNIVNKIVRCFIYFIVRGCNKSPYHYFLHKGIWKKYLCVNPINYFCNNLFYFIFN